jgi:hypothetical protein
MSPLPDDYHERRDEIKIDECVECGGLVEIHRPPGDEFVTHAIHPTDGHDARPKALNLIDDMFDDYWRVRTTAYQNRDKADLCEDMIKENGRLVEELRVLQHNRAHPYVGIPGCPDCEKEKE